MDQPGSRTFGAIASVHCGPARPCCIPRTFWARRFWTCCCAAPTFFMPGIWSARRRGGARLTATIHDLTSWIMPEVHTPIDAARRPDAFAERILKRADGLIAVSENTRQDAIRLLGIKPERIRTIHSGVAGRVFRRHARRAARQTLCSVRGDGRASQEPGHAAGCLEVAETGYPRALRSGDRGSPRLEFLRHHGAHPPGGELSGLRPGGGTAGPGGGRDRCSFIRRSTKDSDSRWSRPWRPTSPVLSSRTSCLPEIAGDAAVYVDPRSPSEMAAQLTRLLESPEERSQLAQLGRARAECYRWERCAQESLEFFREIAGA